MKSHQVRFPDELWDRIPEKKAKYIRDAVKKRLQLENRPWKDRCEFLMRFFFEHRTELRNVNKLHIQELKNIQEELKSHE